MKKVLIILLLVLVVLSVGFYILAKVSTSSISKDTAKKILNDLIVKDVEKSKDCTGATVLIYSDKLDLHEVYALERDNTGRAVNIKPDTPFHVASIGKTFTAVLIAKLQEAGRLKFSDKVSGYLDADTLKGLFVYDGVDYQSEVTIQQLLGHTSGVADYFADPVNNGKPVSDLILTDPNHLWTPMELIDFSRDNQKAINKPGASYHYSDTGYILLGLIIEKVTGKPFHENLKNEIFKPLQMDDSYLMFYSEPKNLPKKEIAKIWFHGTEVSKFNSLSVDWSGGGIISTVEDLLKFQKALREGRLVSKEVLSTMENYNNKFMTGIYYGLGMMQFRFEEYFFLLKGYPRMTGHMGILSTFMFYDDVHDAYVIINFGSDAHMQKSVQNIIKIVGTLDRIR